MAPEEPTKDDVYCKALAKALYHDKCPLTVGLYTPWGRNKDDFLAKIRKHLNEKVKEHMKILRGMNLFHIMFRLLFYTPLKRENLKSIHFVFIRFSAWECTGSDHLWAGLVTALFDGIKDEFGLIPLSIYRALYKSKKIEKKKNSGGWVAKKFLNIPLWLVTLFVFMGVLACAVISITLIYIFHGDLLKFILYIFVPMVSLCALEPFIITLQVTKNLIVTQKVKVLQKLKRKDMSTQLGFMADVKTEVDTITSYLQMMEIFQKMKIRVIIEITKLDNCLPNRVVEVLNAINILLSNKDAPFISILNVDPGVIVECVEKSDLLKGMANNGYLFLNRVVTLPFFIPQMNYDIKSKHLNDIIYGKKNCSRRRKINKGESNFSENEQFLVVVTDDKEANPLIQKALDYLKSKECIEYIADNVIIMRRIVNSIVITLKLMAKDEKYLEKGKQVESTREEITAHKVSKWVIMAAQWPCSFSWILQCIEDEQQSREDNDYPYEKIQLQAIYEISLDALHANRESLKQLLELDGDPDTFCKLLECTDFTVEDANTLRQYTVNLDHTIQRKIELLQGSFNFLRFKKERAETRMCLLDMNIEEVCDKMEKLHLNAYTDKIKDHHLNGKALLYSKNEEIREALDMKLGEWVTFTEQFLRLPTPNLYF